MALYGHIMFGVVREVFTPPSGFTIEECFHPDLKWVQIDHLTPQPQVGWKATKNSDGTYTFAPPAPVTVAKQTTISAMAFKDRLTPAEFDAIMAAAPSNPAVMVWVLKYLLPGSVNLTDPQTKTDLDGLVSAKLLTAARETEILTP